MSLLQDILYQISTLLLAPVLVLLVGLFGCALLQLGGFLRELLGRRNGSARHHVDAFLAFAAAERSQPERVEDELDRIEDRFVRRVDRSTFLSKIGPMLGLAGTLIPLGPGLKELGASNLAGFAESVVVAFTTTVTGLAICAICFVIAGVRGRWYEQDLRAMERGMVGISRRTPESAHA